MRILIIVLIALLISGCSFFKCEPVTEYYVSTPEDRLIVDAKSSPPPSKEKYEKAKDGEKLKLMTEAYNNQCRNIDEINVRMDGLRMWKIEELKKVPKK